MGIVSDSRLQTAGVASRRANQLGKIVYWTALVLFALLTAALIAGGIWIYQYYTVEYYFQTRRDWEAIRGGWTVLFAGWLAYSLALALIALVGAVAQAKAESLEIQIEEANTNV